MTRLRIQWLLITALALALAVPAARPTAQAKNKDITTMLVFDSTLTTEPNQPDIGPIDVRGFKQVRVIMGAPPDNAVRLTPQITLDGGTVVELEPEIVISETFVTRTYDIPGETLSFGVRSTGPFVFRVVVYGREN